MLKIYARFAVITISLFGTVLSLAAVENKPAAESTDRPEEGALFGRDSGASADGGAKSSQSQTSEGNRDAFASGEAVNNPLQIGGTIYYRFIASPQAGGEAKTTPISLPLQVDAFLDGRPDDRLRIFVNARLLYDATRDKYSKTTSGTTLGSTQTSSTASVSTSVSSLPNNPQVVLDQAWLKFDIARAVFITGGNQHVKWGTSRFWNPTDFINTQKRDPLLPYDLRLGLPMLRAEIPLEFISSNFTAMGFFDQPTPASTISQLGAAARYEILLGNTEIGIDAIYRTKENMAYGIDFSAPLGPLDIYAEAACITKAQTPHYTLTKDLSSNKNLADFFTEKDPATPIFQVSGGLNYTLGWLENRQATLGVEYFYNQSGYDNYAVYPILIYKGAYQPFYLGQHYAAFYLSAEGPDAGKRTSYTLSVLSNLSDLSLIGRLDFSWRFLTYLTFEMFVDGHFGNKGGEFNFALDTPALFYQANYIAAISIPATTFDAGMALRAKF